MLDSVQAHFVKRLEAVSSGGSSSKGEFLEKTWERDAGVHGGGKRFGVVWNSIFNRASVNYSGVFYDDMPEKVIKSATALSVIIHPKNPYAPSMHCHFSYTEPREGTPFWRMISDLNPSIFNPNSKNKFEKALKDICPNEDNLFDDGKLFGDKYFFIPELNMYRGTSHLFIAKLQDGEMEPADSRALAEKLAIATIDTYTDIIQEMLDANPFDEVSEQDRALQLAYHTAYFYQVLFLDCGTTAGLMTHSENDVGTLASLPTYINVSLLREWLAEKVKPPHDILLTRILEVLPETPIGELCHVTDEVRQALATTVREYYLEDKSRTAHQADMDLKWWASRKQ
jgi:coproporphyrinogen III oxidase